MGQFKDLGCAESDRQGQAQRGRAFPVVTPARGRDQSPEAAAPSGKHGPVPRARVHWVSLANGSSSLPERNWPSRALNHDRYRLGPSP